jgi:flavin-dependent dehydrogenase
VIGADGRHSLVARAMGAEVYDERPARMAMYYAYWRDLPVSGFETTIRVEHKRGWAAAPTHDGLTVLGVGWPIEEFHANRGDIEASYLAALDFAPEFAERVRGARRESRFAGTAELGGWFRKPYGPGWALVGDAGYHKNPITAMGISDAFRDAELLAAALAAGDDLASYRHERDQAARAMYEMTDEFARLEPPPAEMQRLLGGIAGDQTGMDAFVSVQAGTLPPAALFAQPAAS